MLIAYCFSNQTVRIGLIMYNPFPPLGRKLWSVLRLSKSSHV